MKPATSALAICLLLGLASAAPASYHWGAVNGTNYLTQLRNQHLPRYCNSGWAQASTSALADRIAIIRGGIFPEIDLSPQLLLTCNTANPGCDGGDVYAAYTWMSQNNITEENCAPYRGLSWKEGLQCNATAICEEWFPSRPSYQPPTFNNYRVGTYGRVQGDQNSIINEVFNNGPVACSIYAPPSLGSFTGTGVYSSNAAGPLNHAVSIVGWGTTSDNTPYWVVRNSWGEYWGDNGYFKVYRGNNTLQIESNCVWAVPLNTWSSQNYPHTSNPVKDQEKRKIYEREHPLVGETWIPGKLSDRGCTKFIDKELESVILSEDPQDYVDELKLPTNIFYGNISGTSYMSWHVNQHLPQYCGSCWAQAGAASIADRIRLGTENEFPKVALAVQVLLNCYAEGSCNGGWGAGPYEFAHKHGIPEFGCQVYEAKDPKVFACSPIQNCKTCHPGDPETSCTAVESFRRWFVGEHGVIKGPVMMKKEIFARGPITCGMSASDKFEQTYTGGIYSEATPYPYPNHYVSVVGWGKDPSSGEEYWIARNSWGTHFGENGYFRIKMYTHNLGLDVYDCFWGVPTVTKMSEADRKTGLENGRRKKAARERAQTLQRE